MSRDTGIWWIRDDQRIEDHLALAQMARRGLKILPVFIDGGGKLSRYGSAARSALHHSLAKLDISLRALGSQLILLRTNDCALTLRKLVNELDCAGVWYHRSCRPSDRETEKKLNYSLSQDGRESHGFWGDQLIDPSATLNKTGNPYQVFTPFYHAQRDKEIPTDSIPSSRLRWCKQDVAAGEPLEAFSFLPRTDWTSRFPAPFQCGSEAARNRLNAFADRIAEYGSGRDYPARNATSGLSTALRFGWLSPHRVLKHTQTLGPVAEPFIRQLWWREFARYLLFHFPHTVEAPFKPAFARFPWSYDSERLERWQKGETGFPLVDAGMRELWYTGTMHNRVRMVVASFIVKDLMQPWQAGLSWFQKTLLDEDEANNVFGWQWCAGCGADGAPFFRIFNPDTQARRYDPDGDYIRHWAPANASPPMVDHATARIIALQAYAQLSTPG